MATKKAPAKKSKKAPVKKAPAKKAPKKAAKKAPKKAAKKKTAKAAPMSTHITVVLDRSGSMASIAADMCGGFDKLIEEQKKVKGKCTVTLLQFDDLVETVYVDRPVANVPPLTLVPRRMTALFDAINRGIEFASASKAQKQVFVIITDGHENASVECNRAQVMAQIAARKDWAFIFLGANQDAFVAARTLGIALNGALTYAAAPMGVQNATGSLSNVLREYRTSSTNSFMGFTEQDRTAAIATQ